MSTTDSLPDALSSLEDSLLSSRNPILPAHEIDPALAPAPGAGISTEALRWQCVQLMRYLRRSTYDHVWQFWADLAKEHLPRDACKRFRYMSVRFLAESGQFEEMDAERRVAKQTLDLTPYPEFERKVFWNLFWNLREKAATVAEKRMHQRRIDAEIMRELGFIPYREF